MKRSRRRRRGWASLEVVALVRAVGERRLREVAVEQLKDLVQGLVGIKLKGIVPPLGLLSGGVHEDEPRCLFYPCFMRLLLLLVVGFVIFRWLCHHYFNLPAESFVVMLASAAIAAIAVDNDVVEVASADNPAVIISATEAEACCHL